MEGVKVDAVDVETIESGSRISYTKYPTLNVS
jgi:hypothetical protein